MLKEKIAVVTGAGRGIGKEIALTLAAEGATVVVNYNGSKERAEAVVEEIKSRGGQAVSMKCNVSDHEDVAAMMKEILAQFGRVDILVNNAGITKDNLIMKMSEADFEAVIDTNLKGTFNTIQCLSRAFLKQRSGKIINIASVVGILGNAGQANYSASKAGVIGLTKTMARELASRGITVNAVAPGFVESEMTAVLSEKVREASQAMIPLGHFGSAQDVANVVSFLASEKADYITGQVISVDGGMAI